MLSTKQKKLRDLNNASSKASSKVDDTYKVRRSSFKYDNSRVAELWANLTMIQQMQGNTVWLDESKKSKLKWNAFIAKLLRARKSRVIVFENSEEIFGFAYMFLEPMNADNAKKKTNLKAVVKEIYIEPAYRKQSRDIKLAELMSECIQGMGIEYIEFDVPDLDI